jgi:hypothetical protein
VKYLSTACLAAVFLLSGSNAWAATTDSTKEQTWDYVRVVAVAKDQLSLDVEVAPFNDCKSITPADPKQKCSQLHLIVKDMVVKDRLKELHPGDRIKITFTSGDNVLTVFCFDFAPEPEPHTRLWVLALSILVCLLLYYVLSRFKPQTLIVGEDNRYSNSKLQIALWFLVLITTYVATLTFRVWYLGCDFIGGVNIPPNLLLLSGMSVLTFGGAKAITTSKVNTEKAAGIQDPKNAKTATPHLLRDLTQDDTNSGRLDFGDLQMLVVTFIAVATYLVLVFHFLGTIETAKAISLPDVDTTLLAAFGLGQGAYLAKKAAGNVGQS